MKRPSSPTADVPVAPAEVSTRWKAALTNILKPISILVLAFGIVPIHPLMPNGVYIALCLTGLVLIWRFLPSSNHRLFSIYIVSFALFNALRTFADNTGNPTSVIYPIDLDAAMFGVNPNHWVQAHLYVPSHIGFVGWAAIATYTSYFTVPYWMSLALWRFKPEMLEGFIKAMLVTLGLGLAIYYLAPTAPPWLASEEGHLPSVVRVAEVERNQLWAEAYSKGTHVAGGNDVAAMPSLHMAMTLIIVFALWRANRALGVLGLFYGGAMAFSLVFLGEHYVTDELAGAALAVVGWRLAWRPAKQLAETAGSLVQSSIVVRLQPEAVAQQSLDRAS